MLECLKTKWRTKTNPKTSPEQSAIFQLVREIHKTNVLTKFHDDLAKNVTSIVFDHKENCPTPPGGHFHDDWAKIVTSSVFTRKTAPPTGSHVFQRTRTTFELNQHIIKTNILTNFELDQDIIRTKLLTKFHEDRKRNVPYRVFTNKYRSQKLTGAIR
ncbi:hypothetical protein DPMN_057500 [Dreissena polymorpha]|uniref:Uncharacterized protein n=1 Tax=Dreissena polymorpha TaxID=45954 RepID=A0A9D4HED9_DREPO|nr:hypothetical protein DPMN_057500 [Dreissena polymorpha]